MAKTLQGPNKDFALHTIGWQAFQDLSASIAEAEYSRTVMRVAKSADEGRDGFFYGVPDEPFATGDSRQTTIQCKHFSNANEKLTTGKLANEFKSIKKLVATGRAHGYVLTTNANVTEAHRKAIVAELEKCRVTQPYVHGREWVVAKILEHHKVRALVPRVYGLGDLSWIKDAEALEQAKSIIDSMGDDLACYVPTKAHRDAVSALDKHRVVLLLGDPAVGKSTIAAALSIAETDADKCEVIYVRNPEEFVSNWNPDIPERLFWVDDAFGSIQYAPELSERWNKVFQTMKAAVKRKNRFILTSRSYIWRQARTDLKASAFPPLTDGRVVVDVEALTHAEKERILYNHLKLGKQPHGFLLWLRPHLDAVVASPFFRPEIARRLGDPAFTQSAIPSHHWVMEFFRYPERFLADTIGNLALPLKAAIGLIFVKAGRLASPLEDDEATKLITESYGVTLAAIKAALDSMKGSFVTLVAGDEDSYWTYKHPTIGDAFAAIVGQHEELISVYLRGTKLTQILREARCGVSAVKGASVAVGTSQYDLLLGRFAETETWPEADVRRFLIRRCGPKFFKEFLARFPDRFPWGKGLSRPASADDRSRIRFKANDLDVLPEEIRQAFISDLENQIVFDADIDFLLDEPEFEALTTPEERQNLLSLAKHDFVKDLYSTVKDEANAYESGHEPEDWFMYLRGSIASLEQLFPDDEQVRVAAEGALEAIADQVVAIRIRIEEEEAEDDDDEDQIQGSAAVSSDVRSIFDDLLT